MALTRITKGVIKPNENYDTHDINSTGIITATGANITGNMTVGGVLTYEDVTSIDSEGIVTAREGIFKPDIKKIQIENATGNADLEIVHDTNNSVIRDKGTGSLVHEASGIDFARYGTADYYARFIGGGKVDLRYNGDVKFETTNTGATVTGTLAATGADINGDIDVDGHTNLDNVSVSGVSTFTGEIDHNELLHQQCLHYLILYVHLRLYLHLYLNYQMFLHQQQIHQHQRECLDLQ